MNLWQDIAVYAALLLGWLACWITYRAERRQLRTENDAYRARVVELRHTIDLLRVTLSDESSWDGTEWAKAAAQYRRDGGVS